MEMQLFHLSGQMLGPGSIILPGNWGRLVRAYGRQHGAFDREAALESFRAAHFPHLPSRLQSVFTFDSIEDAYIFRKEPGFNGHALHVVTPCDPDAPRHRARILDFRARSPDDVDWPARYWRGDDTSAPEPAVGVDPGVGVLSEPHEVLIGGPVRVEALLQG